MCRDAVAIPFKPFKLPSASVTARMLAPYGTLDQWEEIARVMEIGSEPERLVYMDRRLSFADQALVAIPEVHEWARSMEVIHEEVIGDVVAVERALVRTLSERVDTGVIIDICRSWPRRIFF